jgi:uncharacterized protein YecE (DUF72 family)
MAHAWIGTSGYDYLHWVGHLYPKGLGEDRWLSYYAERFGAVELNSTFYRLPAAEVFDRWAGETPEGFRFVVKGSRYVTHVKRLAEPEEPVRRLFAAASRLGEKLSCVLWQMPPRLKVRVDRLRHFLEVLAADPGASRARHAFEFRDETWFSDAVYEQLGRSDAALVLADSPFELLAPGMTSRLAERPELRVPLTASWAYVRRHGPGARYAGSYTPEMIRADAEWLVGGLGGGRDAYVFYNNDADGHAVANARSLEGETR